MYYFIELKQKIRRTPPPPKQRAYLRGLGNALDPVVQVGKEGLNENLITSVQLLLQARELVKIKVLKNCELTAREIADNLSSMLNAEIVQVIGAIIILYKKSTKKNFKHIELP